MQQFQKGRARCNHFQKAEHNATISKKYRVEHNATHATISKHSMDYRKTTFKRNKANS